MLSELIQKLSKELDMSNFITSTSKDHFRLEFRDNVIIEVSNISDQIFIKSSLGVLPSNNHGAISKIMEANLFGRGTFGGVISLDKNGSDLNYTLSLPPFPTYKEFYDKLEGFLNNLTAIQEAYLKKTS